MVTVGVARSLEAWVLERMHSFLHILLVIASYKASSDSRRLELALLPHPWATTNLLSVSIDFG